MHRFLKAATALLALIVVAACSKEAAVPPSAEPSGARSPTASANDERVSGRIRSTAVTLDQAEFTGDLAIYTGDGWGFNPSLMIFLFLGEEESAPEGRIFTVRPEDEIVAFAPHVHYRWRNPETDQIETAAVVEGYGLELEFGTIEGDYLPGRLEFSVPGEETAIAGQFQAPIKAR